MSSLGLAVNCATLSELQLGETQGLVLAWLSHLWRYPPIRDHRREARALRLLAKFTSAKMSALVTGVSLHLAFAVWQRSCCYKCCQQRSCHNMHKDGYIGKTVGYTCKERGLTLFRSMKGGYAYERALCLH